MSHLNRTVFYFVLTVLLLAACFPTATPPPESTPTQEVWETPTPRTPTATFTPAQQLIAAPLRTFTGPAYISPECTGDVAAPCQIQQHTAIHVIARSFTGDVVYGLGEGSTRDVTIIAELKDVGVSEFWRQYLDVAYGGVAQETKREWYTGDPPDTADYQLEFNDLEALPQHGQTVTLIAEVVPFVWVEVPDGGLTDLAADYEPQEVSAALFDGLSAQSLTDVGLGNVENWFYAHQIRFYVQAWDAAGNSYYMPGQMRDGRYFGPQTGYSSYRVDPGQWPTLEDRIVIDTAGHEVVRAVVGVEIFCAPVALCSDYWQFFSADVR